MRVFELDVTLMMLRSVLPGRTLDGDLVLLRLSLLGTLKPGGGSTSI
jgi:hypothetical protein